MQETEMENAQLKEYQISLYDIDNNTPSKITLDDTSQTGAFYNFSNDEFILAVEKVCKENNIKYEFNSNDDGILDSVTINFNDNEILVIDITDENNKIIMIGAYSYNTESKLESEIFNNIMLELFEASYVEQISKATEELSSMEYRYVNNTLILIITTDELLQFGNSQPEELKQLTSIPLFMAIPMSENYYKKICTEMNTYEIQINENKAGTVFYDTNSISYIKFTSETEFEMIIGEENSEFISRTGTYTKEENIVTLNVSYDSNLEPNEYNGITEPFSPYQMQLNVTDTDTLSYVDNDTTFTFLKKATNNFLNDIYAKYPNEKDNICFNDYNEYWLLDRNGNKIYFFDLASFETALEQTKKKYELDINKFITELSYGTFSTLHDGIHGGDGYRYDNEFYNNGLSQEDFEIKKENNQIIYILKTNGNTTYNYPFTLTIKTTTDNYLEEIIITSEPTNLQAKGLLDCAKEVEEALSYTLHNKRNPNITESIKSLLQNEGYIDIKTKDYDIKANNVDVSFTDSEYGKNNIFTIENNTLSYNIIF